MARLPLWLTAALVLLAWSAGEPAEAVTAAGDGGHVWLVQPLADEPGTLLAHHGPGDASDTLAQVRLLGKAAAPRGAAAAGATLYFVYRDGTVQIVEGQRIGVEQRWLYQLRPGPSLPQGATLRSLGVGRDGPWALVRVEDPATLARIDGTGAAHPPALPPLTQEQQLRNLYLGLPPNLRLPDDGAPDAGPGDEGNGGEAAPESADAAATEGPTDPPPSDPAPGADEAGRDAEAGDDEDAEAAAVDREAEAGDAARTGEDEDEDDEAASPTGPAVDRLLHLQAGRWQVVPLPDDWPHGQPAQVVASQQVGLRLVVRPAGVDGPGLHVYRWQGDAAQWTRETYDVPAGRYWAAAAVGGHVVAAWQTAAGEALRVESAVLRQGRVQPLGPLELAGHHLTWDVAGTETALWLIAQHTRVTLDEVQPTEATLMPWRWTSLDLQGTPGPAPEALQWRAPAGIGRVADYVIMVGVLVSAVLLMLLFWRRDAAANQLALPETLALGDLPRRFMAATLDLIPPVLVIMATYQLEPAELMVRWPGSGAAASWQAIEPGVLAIALFVGYTTVSELLLRRTVGKAIFGLFVADLQGGRPRVWQLLVRNLLKSFDLVAWPLLILIVLGPYRQRLGDLIARTVVVSPAGPEEEEEREDDE